ncbi:MAG: hypothetical protein WCC27_17710 [Acidobacteriaceae bacterium]
MFDLAVAYRIYPGVSKTPACFADDKYKLSELCLRSFQKALGGLRAKIWAILDGCPPEYEALFRGTFASDDLEIVSRNRIGNAGTFALQVDILTEQNCASLVYLAEDDYFYLPNALEKMAHFIRENPDADFVTPYDHPDSYNTASRAERHIVRPSGDRYWRTASSTCLTFMSRRENLIRMQSLFRSYSRGNLDCSIWLTLTQKLELADIRVHWSTWLRLKIWALTWWWGWRQLLFSRRYRLWSPMPTLATHMEASCLSPLIDWRALFVQAQRTKPIS